MTPESNEDIIKGIISSELVKSAFKPQFWYPGVLALEEIRRIIQFATTFFPIEEGESWIGKISILPIPIHKFLGLTYFYKKSSKVHEKNIIGCLTLLISESASEFLYRNVDRLKKDLEFLAGELNKNEDHRLNLTKYYSNLLEFIDRYQTFRKMTGVKDDIEDIRTGCVLLTYFNSKYGPKPFYCYPEDYLSEKQEQRLIKELEHGSEEGVFIKLYPDFAVIHLNFELKSKLARGKVEMCLVSVVLEEIPTKEVMDDTTFRLLELIDMLYMKPEVSLGLHDSEYGIKENFEKIIQMSDYLSNWVKLVYKNCIEDCFKKSTEGEYAKILMNINRVKLLEKLSEGPIELKKLEKWVSENLENEINFQEILSPLIDSDFVIIKDALEKKYVILLKGLRIYRISPSTTLEKLKSFSSVYPEVYPDLLKQYTKELRLFLRKYRTTRQETVLLSSIIFDPINYLIISKLRKVGIYLKADFEEALGEHIYKLAARNLKFLKEQHIITEIKANNELFLLLKSDIRFVKTIPKYIFLGKKRKVPLPEPLKKVSSTISEIPSEVKNIFKRWFA